MKYSNEAEKAKWESQFNAIYNADFQRLTPAMSIGEKSFIKEQLNNIIDPLLDRVKNEDALEIIKDSRNEAFEALDKDRLKSLEEICYHVATEEIGKSKYSLYQCGDQKARDAYDSLIKQSKTSQAKIEARQPDDSAPAVPKTTVIMVNVSEIKKIHELCGHIHDVMEGIRTGRPSPLGLFGFGKKDEKASFLLKLESALTDANSIDSAKEIYNEFMNGISKKELNKYTSGKISHRTLDVLQDVEDALDLPEKERKVSIRTSPKTPSVG